MSRRSATYCAVTVVCDRQRLDMALPAAVPVIDLLPALLRLLLPAASSNPAAGWQLAPIGRPALAATDTLEGAGVLVGEVLLLEPVAERLTPTAPAASVRDQLEHRVQQLGRAWTKHTTIRFLCWLSATAGAALLVPAAWLTGAVTIAGQLSIAGVLAAAAIAAAHRSEQAAAAACLLTGCAWAALAGWRASAGGGPVVGIVGAAVAALLLAAVALLGYPSALVHAGALGVISIGAGAAGIAAAAGVPAMTIGVGMAVAAVLVIGVTPRVVLAATGLSPAGTSAATPAGASPVAAGFARADRLLIGVLIGVSVLAAVSALPAAFAGDGVGRSFAAGVGAALLLRSRVFSQVPHVLPARVAGVAVLAAVGIGWYLADPGLRSLLLLVPILAITLVTAAVGLTTFGDNPVGRARAARALDLAEKLLVVALIVLATGLLGGFAGVQAALG